MAADWIRGFALRCGPRLARLPARCEICRAWPARPVCASCAGRFAAPVPRCSRCALPLPATRAGPHPGGPALWACATAASAAPLAAATPAIAATAPATCARCQHAPPPLDACVAALDYAYPWDALVARFKFHGEPGWAATLAGLMRAAPGAAALLARADRVLPLPLAPGRLARRGYNQALELARHLACGRLDTGSLHRIRDTAPQARLDRDGRQRNVAGAFAVPPGAAKALRGRRLLLVDDVMTSGATLAAAALALREAGAGRVSALVLARTDDA